MLGDPGDPVTGTDVFRPKGILQCRPALITRLNKAIVAIPVQTPLLALQPEFHPLALGLADVLEKAVGDRSTRDGHEEDVVSEFRTVGCEVPAERITQFAAQSCLV